MGVSKDTERVELLETLPADEVARLFVNVLRRRKDVRRAVQKIAGPHGMTLGGVAVENGEAIHNQVVIGQYSNVPTACVASIMRQHPETGEWEILLGQREYDRSRRTLIGGYFNAAPPEIHMELFGEIEDYVEQRRKAEEVRRNTLKKVLPITKEEDLLHYDLDLESALRKEIFQEAGIYLIPKQLNAEERRDLKEEIKRRMGDRRFAITENYDIFPPILFSEPGTAEKDRQININGYPVVLHDYEDFDLEKIEAGDDIDNLMWVRQRCLSPEAGVDDEQKIHLGNMIDGDAEFIAHGFSSILSEHRQAVYKENGEIAYYAKPEQLILKIDRICAAFGLERHEMLGHLPERPIGDEAADYFQRYTRFMDAHQSILAEDVESANYFCNAHGYEAEKKLLLAMADEAANPNAVREAVKNTTLEDYEINTFYRNAVGLAPTEAQDKASTMLNPNGGYTFAQRVNAYREKVKAKWNTGGEQSHVEALGRAITATSRVDALRQERVAPRQRGCRQTTLF